MNEDFEKNLGLVWHYVKKYCHPSVPILDSEEYAQGCLGLWQACQTYKPEHGVFSTYAYHCIQNAIISEKRRQGRFELMTNVDDIDQIGQSEKVDAIREISRLLRSPVSKPSEYIDRKMLISHFLDGKTLQEVGDQHGVSKGRVWQRMVRALEKLREVECTLA